jgi:methyl-accepting chemotaxis protein
VSEDGTGTIGIHELRERLDFMGLDDTALQSLRTISHHVDKHLPLALSEFYKKLVTVPAVKKFFDGKPQMDRAESRQNGHWSSIAQGRFDAQYLESARKVGLRHALIGLEPRWYIGGYGLILDKLLTGVITDVIAEQQAATEKKGMFGAKAGVVDVPTLCAALSALVRAVMIDIDMAVTVYFNKLTDDNAEHERSEKAKVEKAVGSTANMLKKLAEGNLAARISDSFAPEFQRIKDDSNAVAERFDDIVQKLRQTSRSLRTATGEILSGANDLSERTTRQAATIEETSAAMEQLMHTVTDNAGRAEKASEKAGAASSIAAEGGAVMNQANEAMERITQSSGKISNIIGMIDDIAFQTNLLALNASVEAARAGEAGKGFAVVAVEVRRLAQNAAQASRDVKELIDQSELQVRSGSQLVADATRKLELIVASVRENSTLMREIAAASGSQTSAIQEITVAVRQMDEMTQHNAALVEETNAAIEQTEAQAAELDVIVDVFETSAVADTRQVRRRA